MINKQNIQALLLFQSYLSDVIIHRLKSYFGEATEPLDLAVIPKPKMEGVEAPLINFIRSNRFNDEELILLLIALVPHIRPTFFDEIISENLPKAGDFPQLGGMRGKNFRGFLPTGETALFILAGDNMVKRLEIQNLFSPDNFFIKKRILSLEEVKEGEPRMSGRIILSQEYVDLLTIGKISPPSFSMRFPAQLIETELDWDNLILNEDSQNQIKELQSWILHGKTLMDNWGMRKKTQTRLPGIIPWTSGNRKNLYRQLAGKIYREKRL